MTSDAAIFRNRHYRKPMDTLEILHLAFPYQVTGSHNGYPARRGRLLIARTPATSTSAVASPATTTTASSATKAAATATTATKAATATTKATLRSRPSLVDSYGASVELFAIERSDCGLGLCTSGHFHKAKSFGPTSTAISHDGNLLYLAMGFESLAKLLFAHFISKVTYVNSQFFLLFPSFVPGNS